jgi:putative spermidine/putrescine transport system substrate-binding protein
MERGYRIAGVQWRQFNGENKMFRFTGKVLALSAAALMATSAISSADSIDDLAAAAKAEGQLTTIALPHDWCGYGAVIDGFKKKYPDITVNELNPDAGSGDEVEAIKANKDNKGPQAPDVIDVGLSFGPTAKADGLLMPYKVSTWDSIPDSAKDAEGYWYGDYYGVLAMMVNKDLVKDAPKDWADLLKPEYANAVALAGDPRSSNQAIQAVYAAGLSTGAAAGEPAGTAGLDVFKKLNAAGNFVPVIGKPATLAQGQTPILINWDYNALAGRDTLKGNPPVDVVIPASGVVAGVYVQAISAYAPHPNAAKLWMEYLYSDEGHVGWLKGYCHPIRFNDLAKKGAIPQEVLDKMPPAAAYAEAVFPTLDEQGASKEAITKNWDTVVGANVQ